MAAAFVYVISGDHGRQKIGSSDNPRQRIKDLQTGSPYPLKFEFIGETENLAGGQIEVEAHFMLNQHRAEGEWFVVPSDVAITAIMAAAHRLGYRCKPIDIDSLQARRYQIGAPTWEKWVRVSVAAAALIPMGMLIWAHVQERIDNFVLILGGVAILGASKLVQWLLIKAGLDIHTRISRSA